MFILSTATLFSMMLSKTIMNRTCTTNPKRNLKRPFSKAIGSDPSHLQVKVFVRVRPFNDREKNCTCRYE